MYSVNCQCPKFKYPSNFTQTLKEPISKEASQTPPIPSPNANSTPKRNAKKRRSKTLSKSKLSNKNIPEISKRSSSCKSSEWMSSIISPQSRCDDLSSIQQAILKVLQSCNNYLIITTLRRLMKKQEELEWSELAQNLIKAQQFRRRHLFQGLGFNYNLENLNQSSQESPFEGYSSADESCCDKWYCPSKNE